MLRFAELIEEQQVEITLLESLDAGKPISDTMAVDVPGAVTTIRWSGEAIDQVCDEVAPTGPGELGLVTRMPLGGGGYCSPYLPLRGNWARHWLAATVSS